MMGYPLVMLQDVFKEHVDLAAFPKVTAYIQRLRDLPSGQATFGKLNALSPGLHHISSSKA